MKIGAKENKCKCCMCLHKACESSPLVDSYPQDKYGGYRPWRSYAKVKNAAKEIIGRKPTGKFCALCHNVYNVLGLGCVPAIGSDAGWHKVPPLPGSAAASAAARTALAGGETGLGSEFGSVKKYYKHVSLKANQMKHTSFLNSLKEWIKQHNDCPDSCRILGKEDLRKVYMKLETKSSTGGTFKAPQREFVYLENWDPEADGSYKPEDIVEETVSGKKRKGVLKNTGKKGHIVYEGFDTKSFEETVQEEAGDSHFTPRPLMPSARCSWMVCQNRRSGAAKTLWRPRK